MKQHSSSAARLWRLGAILVIFLAGCSSGTARPVVSPTLPAATIPPTAVIPSATTVPSVTPTPLITMVAVYSPTPALITPAPAEGTFTDPAVKSPDGTWTALPRFETLSSGYHVSLKIFNTDKSVIWTPVDFTGDGLGHTSPVPEHWSADGRFFYYSELMVPDGCADVYPAEKEWKRLDLQTGLVDSISLPEGRSHAVSPDDQFLAYTTVGSPVKIVLVNQSDQSETQIPLPVTASAGQEPEAGGIVWSPDGNSLVLVGMSGSLCQSPLPEFSLLTVNRSDLSVKSIYQGKDYLRPLRWSPDGKILVSDWNSRSWWILADSGVITSAPKQ